jgi:hypothetical protein
MERTHSEVLPPSKYAKLLETVEAVPALNESNRALRLAKERLENEVRTHDLPSFITFLGQGLYLFFNQQTMHVKSKTHDGIAIFFLTRAAICSVVEQSLTARGWRICARERAMVELRSTKILYPGGIQTRVSTAPRRYCTTR